MAGKRAKRSSDIGGEIEMTPMIDVVFQLLVYFIVTIKPVDVAAHLDVFRPAAGSPPPEETAQPPKMIRVQIFPGALVINDRSVSMRGLTGILEKLAAIKKDQTVMIMCARDSRHEDLIEVLDRCAQFGLTNLSVSSIN